MQPRETASTGRKKEKLLVVWPVLSSRGHHLCSSLHCSSGQQLQSLACPAVFAAVATPAVHALADLSACGVCWGITQTSSAEEERKGHIALQRHAGSGAVDTALCASAAAAGQGLHTAVGAASAALPVQPALPSTAATRPPLSRHRSVPLEHQHGAMQPSRLHGLLAVRQWCGTCRPAGQKESTAVRWGGWASSRRTNRGAEAGGKQGGKQQEGSRRQAAHCTLQQGERVHSSHSDARAAGTPAAAGTLHSNPSSSGSSMLPHAPGAACASVKGRPPAASSLWARHRSYTAATGAAAGKRRCTRRPSGRRTAARWAGEVEGGKRWA